MLVPGTVCLSLGLVKIFVNQSNRYVVLEASEQHV